MRHQAFGTTKTTEIPTFHHIKILPRWFGGDEYFQYVVKNTDLAECVEIFVTVHAMKEFEIDVVVSSCSIFQIYVFFCGVEITTPTVLAVLVINGAEMNLQKHFVKMVVNGSSDGCIGCACRAKIEEIDTVVYSLANDSLNLIYGRLSDAAIPRPSKLNFSFSLP